MCRSRKFMVVLVFTDEYVYKLSVFIENVEDVKFCKLLLAVYR
jgi:hypothetical protein